MSSLRTFLVGTIFILSGCGSDFPFRLTMNGNLTQTKTSDTRFNVSINPVPSDTVTPAPETNRGDAAKIPCLPEEKAEGILDAAFLEKKFDATWLRIISPLSSGKFDKKSVADIQHASELMHKLRHTPSSERTKDQLHQVSVWIGLIDRKADEIEKAHREAPRQILPQVTAMSVTFRCGSNAIFEIPSSGCYIACPLHNNPYFIKTQSPGPPTGS
jgi:hypothetical protein